jgi:hypothetical protein
LTNYNSYHANLILLHHLGFLSIDLKSTIPRITLSNWKKKDISKVMGWDIITDNEISLLKEIAVLSHLLKTAPFLVNNHNLRNRKSLIINNIIFPLFHQFCTKLTDATEPKNINVNKYWGIPEKFYPAHI